ncbi:MAG: adenylosuccinate lyase [Candidatus Thorarchaeota archaeon]|nr:adenylosuccinate lyase [Candidatus Thorarchaeota archaeon]
MIHPIDYRYEIKALEEYLSPTALLQYQLRVEMAYITALSKLGICSRNILDEYEKAEPAVTFERVSEIESELKHDVKAMVEALKEQVSPSAKPFCHLGLTSADINVTANALLIREVSDNLLLPALRDLLRSLIQLARKHAGLVQMGRTHGQHAEPTTFGYAIANHIERIGRGLLRIERAQAEFRGKLGGAVGTRAGLDLVGNSEKLEAEALAQLGLVRVEAPTQIANQEELANFYSQLLMCLGTITDLANDFRQLQRTEIGEVFESTANRQVGSSTMPQKRNPVGWENIVSHYKLIIPRLITAYLNLISEHQRDLTDSAANRYLLAEILNTFLYCVRRATGLLEKVEFDEERMRKNFTANSGFELAEPAYIILALSGDDNAHQTVREMVAEARQKGISFATMLQSTESFRSVLETRPIRERHMIENSSDYIGRAREITESVCVHWEDVLRKD